MLPRDGCVYGLLHLNFASGTAVGLEEGGNESMLSFTNYVLTVICTMNILIELPAASTYHHGTHHDNTARAAALEKDRGYRGCRMNN